MTRGQRQTAPAVARLSEAEFLRAVERELRRWHADYIDDHYEGALSDADEDDVAELQEAWKADLADGEVMNVTSDQDWVDSHDYEDDPERDSHGRIVPIEELRVYALSIYPEFAGIGLGKPMLFDRRTGEVLYEYDMQD
ncbi:hypothetical protein OAX78_04385, partial [Planctomycetota bacterium]|nr:hypothetical protein [Planctomycetota bacterium]